jgi:lipopolysaccharide export system permease protein
MFKIIDRYIFKELLDPFLFGLISFSLILSASMVLFELVRAVILQGLPLITALQVFLYRLPGVMIYIFPMATLLASLLGFGRMSKDSETIAFKASGISFYRMIIPVIIMGLLISVITLLFYEIVVPESNKAAKNLIIETQARRAPRIEENVFVPEIEQGELKRIFYARRLKGQVLEGVIVSEFSDGQLSQIINAKTAEWQKDRHTWLFRNGIIYLLSEVGEYKHLIKFEEQQIAIKYTPADFYAGDRSPEDMNIRELSDFIRLKEKMGVKVTDFKIQLNMKVSIPFACLVFALLGAPLGLSPRRASSSIGLGFSILVIFFYYVLMFFSMALGELEWISPATSAWIPNLITGGIGFAFVYQAARA